MQLVITFLNLLLGALLTKNHIALVVVVPRLGLWWLHTLPQHLKRAAQDIVALSDLLADLLDGIGELSVLHGDATLSSEVVLVRGLWSISRYQSLDYPRLFLMGRTASLKRGKSSSTFYPQFHLATATAWSVVITLMLLLLVATGQLLRVSCFVE